MGGEAATGKTLAPLNGCGRTEALLLLVPWRSAVMLGADEGFEFTKAYLLSQGVALYDPIWNDQPPLHTAVTALFFVGWGRRRRLPSWWHWGLGFFSCGR